MVKRNIHIAKLASAYLFPEITRRKELFLKSHQGASLISLGIGDTTEPLPKFIAEELSKAASALATREGYTGYGPEEGYLKLREKIAEVIYGGALSPDEIFISDGTNSDIGRLQILFGGEASIAVQDPSYPAYVDTSVILGQSKHYRDDKKQYEGISYMPCTPSNHFFPDLENTNAAPIIYFCSPNNPTGISATHAELKALVDFAKKNRSVIIFDTAYAAFITDPSLPKSIYEIEGAKEVAIELGSFSKMAGFTGVRLGWSTVPKELRFEDGHSINCDWRRVHTTFFNGASNIAQLGGLALLSEEGQKGIKELVSHYMENARLLRKAVEKLSLEYYGGHNAPYLWIKTPGLTSWEAFERLLERCHLISAPGSGFGPSGEGFIRLSAFGSREHIIEGASRLHRFL